MLKTALYSALIKAHKVHSGWIQPNTMARKLNWIDKRAKCVARQLSSAENSLKRAIINAILYNQTIREYSKDDYSLIRNIILSLQSRHVKATRDTKLKDLLDEL